MMSEREESAIRALLLGAPHFDVLKLPRPYPDLMGEPLWDVAPENVNRAFRKLSLHCHPDKSSHPEAPRAFELLKKAKRVLQSELESETYIRNFLREQKTLWEGTWTNADETATAKERVSSMREDAQQDQSDDVVDAMRRRREKAELAARVHQRKAKAREQSRRRQEDEDDLLASEGDEGDAGGAAVANAPHKRSAVPPRKPGRPGGKRAKFL